MKPTLSGKCEPVLWDSGPLLDPDTPFRNGDGVGSLPVLDHALGSRTSLSSPPLRSWKQLRAVWPLELVWWDSSLAEKKGVRGEGREHSGFRRAGAPQPGRQHWAGRGARGPRGGPKGRAPPAAPPRGGLTDRCRIALSIFSPPSRYRMGFCGGAGGTERRAGGQWVSYTRKEMDTQMGKERQNGFQRSSSRSSESWSAQSSRIRRISERKNAESEPRRRGMHRWVMLP